MRTKIVGLTGGIGSGKTTVARYFMSWGVPVYIADDEAKKILFLPETVREVGNAFGQEVLSGDTVDRQKLAAVVFNNPEKLATLNEIIHPKVKDHFRDWVHSNNDKPCVIKETAILFESGSYKDCDAIILVTAPLEERIERVMKRDGVKREDVLARMATQWDDQKKIEMSDFVIENGKGNDAKKGALEILKIITKIED